MGVNTISALEYLGSNPSVLGVATLCTLLGFCVSIYTMIKTKSIDKQLKRLKTAAQYNEKRKTISGKFKGHLNTINKNQSITRILVSDIRALLVGYKEQFKPLFTIWDWLHYFEFRHTLSMKHEKIDLDNVRKHCSDIIGRLDKEEEIL